MKDALGAVQTILVLGGSSDIGVACAARLAKPRDATVVLAGRPGQRSNEAADRLRRAGVSSVVLLPFDATDTDAHEGFVGAVEEALGGADLDVAIVAFGLLGDQERDEAGGPGAVEVARTNYVGAVSVGLPLARLLVRQGHGTLVVLSSIAGYRTRSENFIYGSSKAGLDGFSTGLAASLAGTGVQVLTVRPGFVHTKMTAGMKAAPLSCDADAVADAVAAGVAGGKRVVWVPGVLGWVATLLGMVPEPLWRRISGRRAGTNLGDS